MCPSVCLSVCLLCTVAVCGRLNIRPFYFVTWLSVAVCMFSRLLTVYFGFVLLSVWVPECTADCSLVLVAMCLSFFFLFFFAASMFVRLFTVACCRCLYVCPSIYQMLWLGAALCVLFIGLVLTTCLPSSSRSDIMAQLKCRETLYMETKSWTDYLACRQRRCVFANKAFGRRGEGVIVY